MAETQTRPSVRGRGSGRGGRGGFVNRGGRSAAPKAVSPAVMSDDLSNKVARIKEIFPDWSDNDIASGLEESNGDVDDTVAGIMNGSISRWDEVTSHKRNARPKKEATDAPSTRGFRGGRGQFSGGGRGRGGDRGSRGGFQSRGDSSFNATNGNSTDWGATTTESTWGASATANDTFSSTDDAWGASAPTTEDAWGAPAATHATEDAWGTSGPAAEQARPEPSTSTGPAWDKPSAPTEHTWGAAPASAETGWDKSAALAEPSARGAPANTADAAWGTPPMESSWGRSASKIPSAPSGGFTSATPTLAGALSGSGIAASKPAANKHKTWASMLRQATEPKPAPPPSAPMETVLPKSVDVDTNVLVQDTKQPVMEDDIPGFPVTPLESAPEPELNSEADMLEAEANLPPPKDKLTESNLEKVADTSNPVATRTAASTAADSWDPRQNLASATATPISASHQQHQPSAGKIGTNIPALPTALGSGFAATAIKATTERASRGSSHHPRRVLDQEEAVRLPANHNIDRATVQFGAFNIDSPDDDDIDNEREEPETRAQPPEESPIAVPRASLPPAPPVKSTPITTEAYSTPKATASVMSSGPAVSMAQHGAPASVSAPAGVPAQQSATTGASPQAAAVTQQNYGRIPSVAQEHGAFIQQKPFDALGGQGTTATAPFDAALGSQTQSQQGQHGQQPGASGFGSSQHEFAAYGTGDQGVRGGANYNNHNNSNFYNQQHYGAQPQHVPTHGHHDGTMPPSQQQHPQHRGFGAYNNQQDNLSQYPQSSSQASRFAATSTSDAPNSGHNTPTPSQNLPGPGQGSHAPAQMQHQPHQHQPHQPHQPSHGPPFSSTYTHPYYSSPYYSNFMYNQSNFGGNYGGNFNKGAHYGQPPHQYAMSQGVPFDHSSSANNGYNGPGSLHRADSGVGSGIGGDYSRGGSMHSGAQSGAGVGAGFGMHENFNRSGASAYPQAGQAGYTGPASQVGNTVNDDLKPPFVDGKSASGPSPAAVGAGGTRPGSTVNTGVGSQSGLPPPQSAQQGMGGYGVYQNHMQNQHGPHGNQGGGGGSGYGMGAGLGQGHNTFPYNNQFTNQFSYGNQQRGWGGNYH